MKRVNSFLQYVRRRCRRRRNAEMAMHEAPVSAQGASRDLVHPGRAPTQPGRAPTVRFGSDDDDIIRPADVEFEQGFNDNSDDDRVDSPIVDLYTSLSDCEKAIFMFFNNQIRDSIALMRPWRDTSLYHAHGTAIFEVIPALLTMEPTQIQRAHDALRHTFDMCANMRKSFSLVQTLGAIIRKPNYGVYSEEEAHAELVYAETMLLFACLSVLQNEEVAGFVRASLRVKIAYNAYKSCARILEQKVWESQSSRAHFESGVRLGLATFDVMVSLLPPKVITLLEMVGFTADKEKGIHELLIGTRSPGLRAVLCELTLLVYYLIIGHFAAMPPNYIIAEQIVTSGLKRYPNSVWFIMFKARLQMLSGMIEESVATYEKASESVNMWLQLKHLTYWEMVWAFAMMMRWPEAAEYASKLVQDSNWSKTIYMYTEAAMNLERGHLISIEERKKNADLLLQRILGRSLPMEKFVIRRCERWARRGYLVLPGVELICLWNMFPHLAAEPHYADRILKLIEQTSDEVHNVINSQYGVDAEKRFTPEYDLDDVALVRYLHGSMLAAMSLPRLGMRHLDMVLSMKEDIKENTFLLPYATVEIAMCHYALGDPDRAIELLNEARKKYSGYLLEARLHFRIHAKLELISSGESSSVVTGTTAGAVALASVNMLAVAGTSGAGGTGCAGAGTAGCTGTDATGRMGTGARAT